MVAPRLDSLEVLAAIVRCGGFRAAALERGVSSSALSQTVNALEEALGIRLLNRTTRSVAPTEAGARLLERLMPALHEIRGAIDDLDQLRESPSGTVRSRLDPGSFRKGWVVASDSPGRARIQVPRCLELSSAPGGRCGHLRSRRRTRSSSEL